MSFAQLKKSRKKNLSKLNEELEKLKTSNKSSDDRFWKLTVDKAGNGTATIRFLPAPSGEDLPWVRRFDHGFQGPGGWYIENSLTTINKKDPVSEHNSELWNSGVESDKDIARKQKRRLSYTSNILVVKDPGNPENDGKVKLFKYGKKLHDKVSDAMNPAFEDETAFNPFDFWGGADFKIRARKVDGFRNYDKSVFVDPAPVSDDDDVLEKLFNQEYSLLEFLDEKNFKSYAELETRMKRVLGLDKTDSADSRSEEAPAPQSPSNDASAMPTAEATAEGQDDSLDFFAKLADES